MTSLDKEIIAFMRGQGAGFSSIAARLGVSEDTVKTHCRRHHIKGREPGARMGACRACGKHLAHHPKRKPKQFCSDACRIAWWNSHPHLVNRKAYYDIACAHCGKVFQSYGNRKRRFCCHPCYVDHRWKGAVHDETGGF